MSEQHDVQWHDERRLGIGASDVAAIIGLSPWKTARDVAEYIKSTGNPDEGPVPLRLWLGLRLEPVIAELTEARLGIKLRRPPKRYWHRNGVMHCELDYLITGEREHVEAKVANFGEDWGADGSTDIPAYYYPQVQAQLAVTGNVACTVAVLYHGQELRTYRIERNEPYIADLEDVVSDWWQRHIVEGIEVPLTARDSELVRRRFPTAGEEEMVATPELALTVEQLRLSRLNMEQAEAQRVLNEVLVQNAMGTASKLVGDGFSITWRNNKDSVKTTTDWEMVAKSYRAALAEAYRAGSMWDVGLGAPELLDAVESLYTVTETKPGARVFRPTWSDKES